MKENIILIGFMGSGKTTVGRLIAKKMGFDFVDTDELIEKKAKMPITEIFASYGEETFRKMESDLLAEMNANLFHTVVSTGGGLPLREENASKLQTLGVVNYLHVTKEIVLDRLKGDTTRPLLAGNDAEEKVEALLRERTPIYEAVCHVKIETMAKSPEEVAKRIISRYLDQFIR